MNLADDPVDYINTLLINHFVQEVGISTIAVTAHDWEPTNIDSYGPGAACGWAWPLISDEGNVVLVSPEVIAATTRHLGDTELDDYLGIVMYVIDRHIALMTQLPDMDPWDRHKKILDDMQAEHAPALGLLSEVQIQANS